MGASGQPQWTDAWQRASIAGGELGAATGLAVACVDLASAQCGDFAGSRSGLVLYVFALTVSMTTAAGLLLGLWSCAARTLVARWRGPRAEWLVSALYALPIAAFALYPAGTWVAEHFSELLPGRRLVAVSVLLALVLCALLSVRGGRWIAGRLARPTLARSYAYAALVTGAVTLAAACYVADDKLYPDDYAEFHDGLAGAFVGALAVGIALMRSALLRQESAARRVRRAVLAIAAVLALLLLVLEQARIDAFRASQALVFTKLVAHARRLSDVDEDGHAAVLGGRDCAAFDARRSPAAGERPENGIDEDCSGKDARWPLAPPTPVPKARGRAPYNVLFISVDTLRADHLGTYGYARPTSPNIDRFAKDAVVFLRAFSQATKTWDSVPSFLTGIYPSNLPRDYRHPRVKEEPNYAFYLKEDVGLIAEAFSAHGYSTSAVVSVSLLRAMGMDRGFQQYKRAGRPTRAAQRQLKKLRPPFMLWLHYKSPHEPYKKHRGRDFGSAPIDRYDSEIAHDDEQVHAVLETLTAEGLAGSTIVVLTSDHGEEFGEHGGFFHTRKLYRELLHVPLILKVPGVAPARVEDVVELVDIAPTLHELCALPPPRTRLDGQSLLATLEGPRPAELGGAYAEDERHFQLRRRALFDGRFRLIDDHQYDRDELYDVDEDPLEQHDIAGDRPDVAQRLRERLAVRSLRSRSPRR